MPFLLAKLVQLTPLAAAMADRVSPLFTVYEELLDELELEVDELLEPLTLIVCPT